MVLTFHLCFELDSEVGVKFAVDVGQTPWNWSNIWRNTECQPHCVADGRVGVLSDDDDLDRIEGLGEGAKHQFDFWQYVIPCGQFSLKELRNPVEFRAVRVKYRVPRGVNGVGAKRAHR